MTIQQLLKLTIPKFTAQKIDNPHLEIELLLSHILKKPREFLLAHGEKKLSSSQTAKFKLLILKRLRGQPIAYLTGHKEFYGLDFKVNKNVLIPRPETELMVEEALRLTTHNPQLVTLVDVGTGSGCIIITLAKQIQDCKFFATDVSAKALIIARRNAKLHGVNKKIKFLKGSLLEPLIKLKLQNSKFKIILANLPYLTRTQIKNSPSIKYEPKSALNGGQDGLKCHRELFKQIQELRAVSYELRDICALCEFDPRQTNKMKQLVKQYLPQAELQIKKDLRGLNRLIIIKVIRPA